MLIIIKILSNLVERGVWKLLRKLIYLSLLLFCREFLSQCEKLEVIFAKASDKFSVLVLIVFKMALKCSPGGQRIA